MSAFVLGSTGLVGSHILAAANKASYFESIATVGRRAPSTSGPKINSIVEKDSSKWPEIIAKEAKGASVFFTALGTTRAEAGSAEKFTEIDYGVNYAAAKAAKEAGVSTFVLISSIGANANSYLLYPKTKGRLEDDVIALKFPQTIILRPGTLLGDRGGPKRPVADVLVKLSGYLVNTPLSFLGYPVSTEGIGKLVVKIAQEPLAAESATTPIVRLISASELTHLISKLDKEDA